MSVSAPSQYKIFFAPLQGFTDAAYRLAHAQVCGGVDAYFAPFLRLERNEIRKQQLRDITRSDLQIPLIPQVIAGSAEEFRRLVAAVLEKGYRQIDLNMGCPFPMQTRLNRGSGLIPHPDIFANIVEEMYKFQQEFSCTFSIKLRLGQTNANELLALLPILNTAPVSFVTLHPRLGVQQYKGETDMVAFETVYEQLDKPLVYNGDLTSVADINNLLTRFPNLYGIMLGRGQLARPTLAEEFREKKCFTDDEIRSRILQIHTLVLADYEQTLEGGEAQVLQKILPFWTYPQNYFGHKFVKALGKSRSLSAYKKTIASVNFLC